MDAGTGVLESLIEKLGVLNPDALAQLSAGTISATRRSKWIPNPGPQTQAYFCLADILLYGGSGGAGKSSLLGGLALCEHTESLLMRRQHVDLKALIVEVLKIHGSRDGFNGSIPATLRTGDGRTITFSAAAHLGKEQSNQGYRRDFLGIDEVVHFLEQQIRFLMGWVGTDKIGQRSRVVFASNPPVNETGQWIIPMFRPWLDLTHPKPAKHGELRWFVTAPDGSDLEVDGPNAKIEHNGETLSPKSRTFIPGRLSDNPYLVRTGYQATLDNLPEPLRTAIRDGNFMASRKDSENQVIPLSWVLAAEQRWRDHPRPPTDLAMTAMAMDVAEGGADKTVIAMRYGGWYAPLVVVPGVETPDGSSKAALVVRHRRDNCPVIVDVGGGYGGATLERLKDNGIIAQRFNSSHASGALARDGSGRQFVNKRAEAWWRFREQLDPEQEGGSAVMLPDDPELRSELTTPTFIPDILKIQIESKADIKDDIGRSTDKADAVIMCLSEGQIAVRRAKRDSLRSDTSRLNPNANVGYAHIKGTVGGSRVHEAPRRREDPNDW